MDEDEIMKEACNKFSRVGNGRNESMEIVRKGSDDEVDRDQHIKRAAANGRGGAGGGGGANPLRVWHQSSRVIRVSRATGGKDRHSKVWTSKGLRDRRVRLSVSTAIQFYDLQDRLGYDQPSKAVEWLIKAAADSIAELPELSNSFPDTPKQLSDEKRASEGAVQQEQLDSAEIESETSKISSLSLSRSEKKKKEHESSIENHQNVNPIPQNSSFTELLTGGIGNNNTSPPEPDFFHKANTGRQWPLSPQMDYFTSGLLEQPSSRSTTHHHQSSGFPGQIQLGNSLPQSSIQPFTVSGQQHQELQHFSFVPNPDQHLTSQQGQGQGGHDYNLNFTISSSLAGFNRGALQSNSPSFLPHHQLHRFSSIEGSSPFYIGPPPPPLENHHFFYGGDGTRSSDHKGKGKN